ncbi:DUF6230 family protein [Streptacidiphilus griseoplanus]|uniref:DUF6230 family protein n=1 Tax=Peterkaempfera griseoplana TaxID=66896 RepID=UPI0006E3C778|nr:DUF6230 family protein [Peterkaempfera griseoplana]
MSDRTVHAQGFGRTRWRRVALVTVPTLAVSGCLFGAMAEGALAASFGVSADSFTVSGASFQISARLLEGRGLEQFGTLARGKHEVYPEALTGIRTADIYGLCQSVVQDVPILGPVTLRLTAGRGAEPVHADRLVADLHRLRGDTLFRNINFGQDASTLTEFPGLEGPPGAFGEQASAVTIRHLRQDTRALSAATMRMPGLDLQVLRGDRSCY